MTSTELWALLSIEQISTVDGYLIIATTDVPCHLWAYYTFEEPWVHRTTRVRRGVNYPWFAYWCFVSWKKVEQQEAGDTLIHTFLIPSLIYCQTFWTALAGTIGGVRSPSESPIFKKHYDYQALPPTIFIGGTTIINLGAPGTWTWISKLIPANKSGLITQVSFWAIQHQLIDLRVATFQEVSPNHFTTREYADLGSYWDPGLNVVTRDHHGIPLHLNVEPGDYIGYWHSTDVAGRGRIAWDPAPGTDAWLNTSGNVIPCTNLEFTPYPITGLYIHGSGN